MKIKLRNALTAVILLLMPIVSFAQTPTLGTAAKYVLFTTDGAMTCSGTKYLTHLTGNVGSNLAGSVTGFGNVDGVMHTFDVETGLCAASVNSLYVQLSTATPTATLASPFGNGTTVPAGVYSIPTAATLNVGITLDAAGDPNAVFIFQIGGVLSTNALSKVKLINGAMACNVFWQVGGAVNVGTGTFMRGTIVANGQIDLTSTLDTLEGRALAINAPVLVSQLVAYTPIGCGSPYLTGPAAPAMLDSTAAYGVFSSIGAVTSTPVTYVIGSVGANSTTPTGFNPLNVTGTIHAMDPSTASAAGDLTNIYNYLVAMPADINLLDPADFGHDLVLTPHSYQVTGITQLTGNLILNAEGNANAVFVIKINGALTTTTLSKIMLINGAQAKNVYWKVDGAVDIFSNSVFNGTLVVAGAISLETGDTLNGRALTINGAVAINGSYVKITPTSCVAPPIGGTKNVCPGNSTVLTDSTLGGKWHSSDSAVAAIDSNLGIVTGIMPGTVVITYTTLAGCIAPAVFTVNGAPSAITGPDSVCIGSTITLSDTATGGTWTSSNILQATVGSTSGIVTGISAGTPTISYNKPGSCAATKTIAVNSPPNAGIITGPSNVCVGSTITLTDTAAGGIWSSSNATATVAGGIVTGVSNGIDTIRYTVANACGIVVATKTVTVSPGSGAGVITGPSSVCVGSTITLTDTTSGGIWSSSNARATVIGGVVTGVSAGIDVISYTVISGCGTAIATKNITINANPNAGIISGPSTVCVGSAITLTESAPGGIWSASNTRATVLGGVVAGITAGIDTIIYTVTNVCGTVTATKSVTVSASPNAGIITGPSNVCVGNSITLTDTAAGGLWSSSNARATVAGGVVTGVTAGIDTIIYTATTGCGTATATKTIVVNPTPNAGTITGASSVCTGSVITLTDTAAGGIWSSSNAAATVVGGVVTGVSAGTDTILYTVSNITCTSTAAKIITVNPLPNAGTITGASNVCVGSSITLADVATGGAWSSSSSAIATVSGGVVNGVAAGAATITYTVTNVCGTVTATKTVVVIKMPAVPVITIQSPSSVCTGTMYQNFGTSTPPQAGTYYTWTAVNATVAAQGSLHMNSLISFTVPGIATVTLNATTTGSACSSKSSVTVNVGPGIAQIPEVVYFFDHFVCTPSNEDSYQWGYDDVNTLDSTILTGEINQDYLNTNPDFNGKLYWVMTTSGGCMQKTYYRNPTAIQNVNTQSDISVYPNPANTTVNVVISSSVIGKIQVDVVNMLGQKVSTVMATDNKAVIDVTSLPAGSYIVTCYNDGIKIGGARFIKN